MRFRVLTYLVCVGALVIVSMMQVAAQPRFARQPFNRWSIDLQAGWNMPLSPRILLPDDASMDADQLRRGSPFVFNRLGAWQTGIRYMVFPQVGVRPYYAYNTYGSSSEGRLRMHHYGMDVVANFASLFRPGYGPLGRRFNLLIYGGGSFANSYAYPPTLSDGQKPSRERLLNAKLGMTPQYQISSWVALYFDLAGQLSVLKDYGYDGKPVPDQSGYLKPGFILLPSLGLSLYLGRESKHADWR